MIAKLENKFHEKKAGKAELREGCTILKSILKTNDDT